MYNKVFEEQPIVSGLRVVNNFLLLKTDFVLPQLKTFAVNFECVIFHIKLA